MRVLSLLLSCLLLFSCSEKITEASLPNLNGYWEIEKVVFPNGDSKDYTVNATIDYIEVKEKEGFRKKVQPLLDGGFLTSNDAQPFTIQKQQEVFLMRYKNKLSSWEETIISVDSTSLVLKNDAQITYIYKRYQPLKLE